MPSQIRSVTIADSGPVDVEVIVGYQKPAGIRVALYDTDRRKERDVGDGVTMDVLPDVFRVATGAAVARLTGKFLGVFVAVSSFAPDVQEPMAVVTILRQSGTPVANGTVTVQGTIVNGGGGVVIVYAFT
jgi:hypothetical protein